MLFQFTPNVAGSVDQYIQYFPDDLSTVHIIGIGPCLFRCLFILPSHHERVSNCIYLQTTIQDPPASPSPNTCWSVPSQSLSLAFGCAASLLCHSRPGVLGSCCSLSTTSTARMEPSSLQWEKQGELIAARNLNRTLHFAQRSAAALHADHLCFFSCLRFALHSSLQNNVGCYAR